ncbi:hypothetical protein BD309DRAFT_1080555 [Dichomitus squalens]|nr:hypothetical protein BD309DRAFT_1080555 [Dichomitus squalens]
MYAREKLGNQNAIPSHIYLGRSLYDLHAFAAVGIRPRCPRGRSLISPTSASGRRIWPVLCASACYSHVRSHPHWHHRRCLSHPHSHGVGEC